MVLGMAPGLDSARTSWRSAKHMPLRDRSPGRQRPEKCSSCARKWRQLGPMRSIGAKPHLFMHRDEELNAVKSNLTINDAHECTQMAAD